MADISTWPKVIWLQNENNKDFTGSMFGEVCWCEDQVHKNDVPYVREDFSEGAAAEIETLKAELKEARELLKPFASFTGKENYIDDGIDIIGEKGVCGNYCVPDSHGFEVIWADENNGQTVHFTAGQFRRVRAFLMEKADG